MTTSDDLAAPDRAGLSAFPVPRPAGCPFDPPLEYAQWRSDGPRRAVWKGHEVWVLSRFEDIRAALTDPGISADTAVVGLQKYNGPEPPPMFPRLDDPEHSRLRRMMTKDFTVRRVRTMRAQVNDLAQDTLEAMISKGQPADLVQDYALPIPSLVISLLLGVPYDDHEFFQLHSATLMSSTAPQAEKNVSQAAMFGYLTELVARKEREPSDDLLSRLVHEYVLTGQLTRETAAVNGHILLQAGHETTAHMIALSALTLLRNPAELARVRDTDDPAVVANAVEELLRYLTIIHDLVVRVASEDVTIGGQLIRAGEAVIMNLPAGNRDGDFFGRPDEFDIDRATRGHLAFGYGVHNCIGAALARAELEVALPALLRRLPGLRLAVPFEEIRFRYDQSVYGVDELPVVW